ncbi:MAG: hypothetical protein ABGY95_05315 [Rubritalea sp.]|uniref:hypothetical protein n=1 Tax=Rubritalea sp. TaxID=2109375 RepID=UPI003242E086
MHPDSRIICGIGLVITGIMLLRTSWRSLQFQKNDAHEYDFCDLALYGGKFCALKNLLRGLIGIFNRKHRALRTRSLVMLWATAFMTGGILLLHSARD